jgi:anti-sigma regulatory factor (Ser/Thr protein kinase)
VAGHGLRAATLMGQLRTGLRAYALDGREPPEVLERVDRLLRTIRGQGMATAVYGIFDVDYGRLRIANAGHPPPLIVSATGEPRFMEVDPAPPLGTLANPSYQETTTQLLPGETVLMYTDGLIEVRGESLREGFDRLAATAKGALSADRLCDQVIHALVPEEGPQDDIAVVALENAPIPAEVAMRLPAHPERLAQVRHVLRRWLSQFGASSEDIAAITLACGEACANAIEHAYSPGAALFEVEAQFDDGAVIVVVRDSGRWRDPRGDHRGRGLRIIESSMDGVDIRQTDGGTEIEMRRRLTGSGKGE